MAAMQQQQRIKRNGAHNRKATTKGNKMMMRCKTQARKSVHSRASSATAVTEKTDAASASPGEKAPLLVRAARGEEVERVPVWMMRQAGRYMRVYRELCERNPSFRARSETTDLSVEISLQPWKAFKPDGVILFSDILTPLAGMGVEFDIIKGKGPVIYDTVRDAEALKKLTPLDPDASLPFVGETLNILRQEVRYDVCVLS